MEPFFDTIAESEIKTAWIVRSRELRTQKLQMFNDLLFKHVERVLTARKAEIQREILKGIRTVEPRWLVHVPLWSYNATQLTKWVDDYRGTMEARQRAGHDDTIACAFVGVRARVREVVEHTDFLARLGCIFPPGFFVRDYRRERTVHGDGWDVYRRELALVYMPNARPDYLPRKAQDAARVKYETHQMYREAPVFRSGHRVEYPAYLDEDSDIYYLKPDAPPPGLSNATPPPPLTRSNEGPPPPPRIMRSMTWGIDDRNPLEEATRAYDEAMDRAVAEFNRYGRLPESDTESEGHSPCPASRCYCGN